MAHPPKKQVALALLGAGTVFVHLDPRVAGVLVPQRLRSQPQVVLQFGYNMPVPIEEMGVDDVCITGIMSFAGKKERCYIPWSAVFALVGDDGKGLFYSESCPKEISDALGTTEAKETPQVTAMRAQIEESAKAVAPPPRNNVVSFAAARERLRPGSQAKGSPFRPKGA